MKYSQEFEEFYYKPDVQVYVALLKPNDTIKDLLYLAWTSADIEARHFW